jgi:hypothetical protein
MRNKKSHCVNGHLYDQANTFFSHTTGRRQCRTCSRIAKRKWTENNRDQIRAKERQRRSGGLL